MTTFAVIGAGAIGGFYGARLAKAGHEVHFLFREDADHVRENGLEVISPAGDFKVHPVNSHEAWDTIPQADVVIVSVKSTVNSNVAELVPQAVRPGGSVLLIQNGLGCEEEFAKFLPAETEMLGSLAFISSQRTGRNEVTHFDHGQLTLGRYLPNYERAEPTANMKAIQEAFASADVPVELVDDLLSARWQKLMWNLPFNPLSVILDALTDALVNEGDWLVRELMVEVRAIAESDGRDIPAEFVDLLMDATKLMTPYAPSMKVDYDNSRTMEVEAMVGNPMRRGIANGVPVPHIEMLYRQLKFLDDRIASG